MTSAAPSIPFGQGITPQTSSLAVHLTSDALLAALGEHDASTLAHSRATANLARRLAQTLDLDKQTVVFIQICALLHDIGKLYTPHEILLCDGALSQAQWEIMQEHALAGGRILAAIPALVPCAPIVRAHHEHYDGTGYPYGLVAEQIPLAARVVAVADAFHAMIGKRPYRKPFTPRRALAILVEGAGKQWDSRVVDAMEHVVSTRVQRTDMSRHTRVRINRHVGVRQPDIDGACEGAREL